jgi:tetratricopeptide (TPR) repeat protein
MELAHWTLPDELRARLLEACGGIAYWQADQPAAALFYDQALQIWRRIGDRKEIANAIYNLAYGELLPLVLGGASQLTKDMVDRALDMCSEALAIYQDLGDEAGQANINWAIGTAHFYGGDYRQAKELLTRSAAMFRNNRQSMMEAWARYMVSMPMIRLGELDAAIESLQTSLRIFHAAGDLAGACMLLRFLAYVAVERGDLPKAGRLYGSAKRLLASTGAHLTQYFEEAFEDRAAKEALLENQLSDFVSEGAAMPLEEIMVQAMEP